MNFFDFINRQNNEDRRAFIVHYPPKSGKTQFARRVVAKRDDVHLLDLQTFFLDYPALPPIHQCGLDILKDIALSLDVPQKVVIIDNPDFLFNIWRKSEKRDFIDWIRYQLRSPGDTEKTYIFMIQTDSELSTAHFKNSHGDHRVLPLSAFETI